MSDQEAGAGWYPDPMRRYDERYWDGMAWTARVRRGLVEERDPEWTELEELDRSGRIPGDAPVDHVPPTPGSAALTARLSRPRPPVSTVDAVAAGGGLVALLGLLVIVGWLLFLRSGIEVGAGEVAVLGVVSIAVAYGAAVASPVVSRAAALGGAVVGPLLLGGAIVSQTDSARSAALLFGILTGAAWLAMFVGPWLTGAPILLVGSLLSSWLVVVAVLVDPWRTTSYDPWSSGPDPLQVVSSVGVVTLLCSVACVLAAGAADRRGMQVLGTPFVAVGMIQSAVGLSAATAELSSAMGASLLSLMVGVLFVALGAMGARRGSLWYGVVLATGALVNVVANLVDDAVGGGVLLVAIGAAVVVLAPAIDRALGASQVEEPTVSAF